MSTSTWTASRHTARSVVRLVLSAAALVTAPAAAHAALGESTGVTISAERLFGYAHTKAELGSGNNKFSGTRSDFAVFMASPASPYSVPRLGLDVFIGNGLTVGGNFGFVIGSTSGAYTYNVGAASLMTTTDADQTTFVLAPRAGYDLALNDKLHLWGRGGITYFHTSNDGNTKLTTNGMALTLEPTFVFMAASNVGFTLGLTFDLPFSGETKQEQANNTTISRDSSYRQIGLLFGLVLNLF
jgi:hypothetical protein